MATKQRILLEFVHATNFVRSVVGNGNIILGGGVGGMKEEGGRVVVKMGFGLYERNTVTFFCFMWPTTR